jgi:hypothetical protein
LGVKEVDHVDFFTRHLQLTWFLAEDETHEAILAIRRTPTNAVTTADGKFNSLRHVAPFDWLYTARSV